MSPINWRSEDIEQISENISSLVTFLNRNHLTLVYDTNPVEPTRQNLLRAIKSLHAITGRMISVEEQRD